MWDFLQEMVGYLKDFYMSPHRKTVITYSIGGLAISGIVALTSLTFGLLTAVYLGAGVPILVETINSH